MLENISIVSNNLTQMKAPVKYRDMDEYLKSAGEALQMGAYYYSEGMNRLDLELMEAGTVKFVEGGEYLAEFNDAFAKKFSKKDTGDLISEQVLNSIIALSKSSYENKAYTLVQEMTKNNKKLVSLADNQSFSNKDEILETANTSLNLITSIELLVAHSETVDVDAILKRGARELKLGTNHIIDAYKNQNDMMLQRAFPYLENGEEILSQAIQNIRGTVLETDGGVLDPTDEINTVTDYLLGLESGINNLNAGLLELSNSINNNDIPAIKESINQIKITCEGLALIDIPDVKVEDIDKTLRKCLQAYFGAMDVLDAFIDDVEGINSDQVNAELSNAKTLLDETIELINEYGI